MPQTEGLPVTNLDNLAIAREFCIKAKNNDVAGMQDFLHCHPGFNIATPFQKGFTALHYACNHRACEAALFLIGLGADAAQPALDKTGSTPLDLCKDDAAFSESISKKSSAFSIQSHAVEERSHRTQLGDLHYESELGYSKSKKPPADKLYSITGTDFKLFVRTVGDKQIIDACFDEESSYTYVRLTLACVGIPNEYVNSRYLIAVDICSSENIEKIEGFYKNPLNRYSEDEILEMNHRKKYYKKSEIRLDLPEPIMKKYYDFNSDGPSVLSPKTDPESRMFFASQSHKRDRLYQKGLAEKSELLAKIARDSLEKSFGKSRPPIKVQQQEKSQPMVQQPITYTFSEKKQQCEGLMSRSIEFSSFDSLTRLLKKYQLKKDGQDLPTPELVLRRAAAVGDTDTLVKLCEWVKDISINEGGFESGKTALDFAQANKKGEAVQFLISKGAKLRPISQKPDP